jgi:PiT family inorganic phosphate transporter
MNLDPETTQLTAIVLIVAVALIFDFINGFHDSANAIATIVSTRVLSPKYAVLWAAFFNFFAVFVVGVGVASMIADTLQPAVATKEVVLGALMGAIAWNLITWYFGIPSSSSHALVGGLVGAGLAGGGFSFSVVKWSSLQKPLLGIVLAPTLCLGLGFLTMLAVLWICRNMHPAPLNKGFKRLQLVSSAVYSLSHGGNDAQKTIGVICVLLAGSGYVHPSGKGGVLVSGDIPTWVISCAYLAIALGTISGGWRIVKTMGSKITKLRPVDGFAAETAGGVIILALTHFKIPVSTTHSIAGSIMGVGATKRLSAVRWGISARIIWAWIITIPASAALAMGSFYLSKLLLGFLEGAKKYSPPL